MNEWLDEYKKKYEQLFSMYGKIISVVILLFVCVCLSLMIVELTSPQKLRVSFLDVGQGDAILIQTPSGKSMLIDGGAGNSILERLSKEMSYFDNDIDVMVETHPDADHVTGLIPVLEKYSVKKILMSMAIGDTKVFEDLSDHIKNENADVYVAHAGDVIDFHDGVVVNVLYPRVNYIPKKNDTNDASVSVVVTYGDEHFLLTGDLPSTEESKLVSSGLMKNITVYKAGHHGSKYSSGEQLLTYIRPEYSVISAGKDNTYGHPNPEAIERLQKYSQEVLSTIERGTITFMTDGRMIEVETSK
ncbi:MAG: MBL fold metallo-hydrolase [Candidatus Paceibacterota bacterium]